MKFKEDAAAPVREEIIGGLSQRGAADVRPLFPGTKDRRLGAMYVIEHPAPGSDLLDFLDGADAVEYAEPEVTRTPAE